MIARIIEILSAFIVATISMLGYAGIVLLMAIESACVPLPSELIMPFAGYLVFEGAMKLFYASGSPYARIVRVVLRETGLDRRVPEQEVTLRDPNSGPGHPRLVFVSA